jgi:DNA-binding NarL/FixJ family response regulator
MPVKKILIVEDENNLRNSLSELLRLSDFEVAMAENGQKALDILHAGDIPDLIISDIVMPDMDGFNLCRYLQADDNFRSVPFIFLTAKSELDEIRAGMGLGADDYITKPVKYDDLISAINTRLKKKEHLVSSVAQNLVSADVNSITRKKTKLTEMLDLLSVSEKRVLKALAEDKTSKVIAQRLFLSVKTVQNHRSNMAVKIGMTGQNSLLAFAVECQSMGLL